MALQGWEQEKHKVQQENKLLKQLMISGKGGSPGQPYDDPEKGKGPFVPPPGKRLMISHGEGRGPQPKYHDEYNQQLKLPPWMQMNEAGELIEIPWMKEKYLKEHPEMAGVNYGTPSQLDKWLQLYQGPGGSLRHIDPDLRKLILQRGTMKAGAANNIRSLQSSGHQTVLDDNRPGHLKIVKQFKPPRA